uniref:Uncharacterized protein n=1 Tax=Anguilla anguilla TaxID=7936 RepID=A0A0E9WT59_ANGAN
MQRKSSLRYRSSTINSIPECLALPSVGRVEAIQEVSPIPGVCPNPFLCCAFLLLLCRHFFLSPPFFSLLFQHLRSLLPCWPFGLKHNSLLFASLTMISAVGQCGPFLITRNQ